jgi:hypothetical protein
MRVVDIAVSTRDGIRFLSGRHIMEGREIGAMASDDESLWFVAGGREIWRAAAGAEPEAIASCSNDVVTLVAAPNVFAGSDPAHLYHLRRGVFEDVAGFEAAEGRDAWYTPWGGPPAVRSIAVASDGTVYANVHVGGILRSSDGGASWTQTIDIDTDVHQVIAPRDGVALAAAGAGFALSRDHGQTWTFDNDGLGRTTYCRATALAGDTIVVSASSSHAGRGVALWRRPLSLASPFERCEGGFPPHVADNIDTFWIAAREATVAVATPDGSVYLSADEGATWELGAKDLPGVASVTFV